MKTHSLYIDSNMATEFKLLAQSYGMSQIQLLRELVRPQMVQLLKIKTPKNMPTWTRNILIDTLIEAKIAELKQTGID